MEAVIETPKQRPILRKKLDAKPAAKVESKVEGCGKTAFSSKVLANIVPDIKQILCDVERDNKYHWQRAGKLLVKAKRHIRHGQWQAWLKDNFKLSQRTAQLWMQLAKLPDEKGASVAHLPLQVQARMGTTANACTTTIDEPETPAVPDVPVTQPAVTQPAKVKRTSKPQLWAQACNDARDAIERLQGIQEDYQGQLDSIPENLAESTRGEKLKAVTEIPFDEALATIDEAENVELPLGYGRD